MPFLLAEGKYIVPLEPGPTAFVVELEPIDGNGPYCPGFHLFMWPDSEIVPGVFPEQEYRILAITPFAPLE